MYSSILINTGSSMLYMYERTRAYVDFDYL